MSTDIIQPTDLAPVAPAADPQEGAIVRQQGLSMSYGEAGVKLQNFAELLAFGKAMVDTGFSPKGFTRAAAVVWAVQRGAELGLGPTAALHAFYIAPSNRPQLYAEAARAVCVRAGALLPNFKLWADGTGDAMTGHFLFQRKGWPEPRESKFTVAEARKAGLIKSDGGWEKWPQRMVLARACSFALHDYFADVLLGCAIEGDETGEAIDVSATPIAQQAPPSDPDPLLADPVRTAEVVEPEPASCDPGMTHAEADAALADPPSEGRLFPKSTTRHRG